MPQEKKIQVLVKFDQFISLSDRLSPCEQPEIHIPPISWGSPLVHILSRELGIQASRHIGRVKVLNESKGGKWKGAWHIVRRMIFNKKETSSAVSATRQLSYFNSLPRKHFPLILQLAQGCLHCLVWSFIRLLIKILPCTHMHCLINRDAYFLPMNQKYFRRRWALFIAYQNTAKFYP